MLFKRNLKNRKMIIFNLSNKSINKINICYKLYFIIMNNSDTNYSKKYKYSLCNRKY